MNLDYFLRPLFNQEAGKIYNLNKALDFDDEDWMREQERIRKEKLKRYETSLHYLLGQTGVNGEITLEEIGNRTAVLEEDKDKLISMWKYLKK